MDEGTLNDLLECSVCLERLDTSSKVLPCQHTFCRKCLQEILQKHKELRCPECRVLINIKIEDLPPNVLLMRILEGMKNAAMVAPPKRAYKSHKMQHNPVQHSPQNQHVERSSNKHSSIHSVPHQPYAKALYDYMPKEPGDLSFKKGDIITLKKKMDAHWYHGECGGKQGIFPVSYVQIITPVPSHVPQCKALYDFRMNEEEEGCLSFNKGDVMNVIRRVDENWAEGKLDGRIGIFPLAFVEMNSLARSLMKLSTNSQPGPSKVAPPTPTAEDSTPLIPTDHSTAVTQNVRSQPAESTNINSSSSSTTPNVSSSNTSSTTSTAPSSPASPPARTDKPTASPRNSSRTMEPRHLHHQHSSKDKRHSLTNLTVPHHTSVHRHSAEIASPISSAASDRSKRSAPAGGAEFTQLPAAFMALFPYKPQKQDELELKKGGLYTVTEICQDGWFKGTSNRTQKCGVFPGNYVTPARGVIQGAAAVSVPTDSRLPVSFTRGAKGSRARTVEATPPDLPPRAVASSTAVWHSPNNNNATNAQSKSGSSDKNKEKKDKGTVGLMRRLASMKISKSPPPPSSYSMDNPVFEDITLSTSLSTPTAQPVHVRSGSCPSQLLQVHPSSIEYHRMFGSVSHRVKHKERPSILNHSSRPTDTPPGGSSSSSPDIHRHRKSYSLDATGKSSKSSMTQAVRERFKCITPYPPNSEYELELQLHDIIYVYKKREDGWYKGTQQRTGKTGLFPASFVESF